MELFQGSRGPRRQEKLFEGGRAENPSPADKRKWKFSTAPTLQMPPSAPWKSTPTCRPGVRGVGATFHPLCRSGRLDLLVLLLLLLLDNADLEVLDTSSYRPSRLNFEKLWTASRVFTPASWIIARSFIQVIYCPRILASHFQP
jgi:hypothetical protein